MLETDGANGLRREAGAAANRSHDSRGDVSPPPTYSHIERQTSFTSSISQTSSMCMYILVSLFLIAFNEHLTLLAGHQEEHPAYKTLSDEVLAFYLSGVTCKWFCIWSSWCHWHPIISCCIKIHIGLTFLPAYAGSAGKRLLNGCLHMYLVGSCFISSWGRFQPVVDFCGVMSSLIRPWAE